MKEEVLNELRERIAERKKYIYEYNSKIKRINELTKNECVKEYIKLLKEVKSDLKLIKCKNEDIIYFEFRNVQHKIEKTNNIYVYMGTFFIDCEHDEREVERNSKNADFRKYWDIEKYNAVVLSIRDSIVFEKENTIIYPKTCLKTDMYYKIQKEFINYACKYGQERAVKRILKKWR